MRLLDRICGDPQLEYDEYTSLGVTFRKQTFIITDVSELVYELDYVPEENSEIVSLNGVIQTRGSSYDYYIDNLDPQTIILTGNTTLETGDIITVTYAT